MKSQTHFSCLTFFIPVYVKKIALPEGISLSENDRLALKRIGEGTCWRNRFSILKEMVRIPHNLNPEISLIAPAFFCGQHSERGCRQEETMSKQWEWNIQQVGQENTDHSQMTEKHKGCFWMIFVRKMIVSDGSIRVDGRTDKTFFSIGTI